MLLCVLEELAHVVADEDAGLERAVSDEGRDEGEGELVGGGAARIALVVSVYIQ